MPVVGWPSGMSGPVWAGAGTSKRTTGRVGGSVGGVTGAGGGVGGPARPRWGPRWQTACRGGLHLALRGHWGRWPRARDADNRREWVSPQFAVRIAEVAGEHAKKLHDHLVSNLKVDQVQADEIYTFVAKKGARWRAKRKA